MRGLDRRSLLAGSVGAGFGMAMPAAWADAGRHGRRVRGQLLNAAAYGAVGDGRADDTDALQRALEALLVQYRGGVLEIPPGTYRVTRPIRVETGERHGGNITHGCVVRAHGARIVSKIALPESVIEIVSNAVTRFLTIEGLEINGSGREAHGLEFTCVRRGRYLYNFCLRDIIVEGCGGDGCRMTGNIFEGQIFNSYFRDNGRNGMTLSHGPENTVLSAVHAFGCVFGGNEIHGVEMLEGATDVGFQGCYFLENGKFGLSAPNGVTLLSHCGFENNQQSAPDFAHGDAGIYLLMRGTLIGCTAYSIRRQTHLIRSYVTDKLVMVGCCAAGDEDADDAGLARLKGNGDGGRVVLLGSVGRVDDEGDVHIVSLDGEAVNPFTSSWDGPRLARLGDYNLWVDGNGRLRMKKGPPTSDEDGSVVGG